MPALSASSAAATAADIDEWHGEHTLPLPLDAFDDRLQLYRLVQPRLERQMASSLREYGQISPVVVCRLDGRLVLVDGFKRLRAARSLKEFTQLNARLLETDPQGAKAAIFQLNRVAGKPVELEEAWIIHALITQDGLKQADVAKLFGRHKSWVNRRFALLQRLCDGALESLRLGLLTPTQARHLTRLPRGNQSAVLTAASKESLTSRELSEVVDLLSDCGTVEQTAAVLAKPRDALRKAGDSSAPPWDPRIGSAANRVAKDLARLSDGLVKMHSWLRSERRRELRRSDRKTLSTGFAKFERELKLVLEAVGDFQKEMKLP